MNSIVQLALAISRERYSVIGTDKWPGLSPDDCFEAICCHIEMWVTLSHAEKSRVYSSLEIRLADGYKLNRRTVQRGMRTVKVRRHRPKHRSTILARDSFACRYCGSSAELEVDHIVPKAQGGEDKAGNLLTACGPCNRAKSARMLDTAQKWLSLASEANRSINLPDDTLIAL